jgi:hypothetical protein
MMSHKSKRDGYCQDMHGKSKELRGELSPAFPELQVTVRGQSLVHHYSYQFRQRKVHISNPKPVFSCHTSNASPAYLIVAGGLYFRRREDLRTLVEAVSTRAFFLSFGRSKHSSTHFQAHTRYSCHHTDG